MKNQVINAGALNILQKPLINMVRLFRRLLFSPTTFKYSYQYSLNKILAGGLR